MWISSVSLQNSFPENYKEWDLKSHKMRLFKEQIGGWQLEIAKYLLFGNNNSIPPHPHSAYGALSIFISYFESIGRYYQGIAHDNESQKYFVEGVSLVYETNTKVNLNDAQRKFLYRQLRCGLHHIGIAKKGIILSEHFDVGIKPVYENIYIAPTKMFKEIEEHFADYCKNLLTNKDLQKNFEKRFDYLRRSY